MPVGSTSAQYIEAINKTHIVFRGNAGSGAKEMLEAMRKAGLAQLKAISDPRISGPVMARFNAQIDSALQAIANGANKIVPDVGELVVFQGKTVPY